MACVTWSYGTDIGCIDIDGDADNQTIGRLYFPRNPRWIPTQLFTLSQNKEKTWEIIPHKFSEVIELSVYQDGLWTVIEHQPKAIEDGVLIRVRMDGVILKMLFMEDLHCIGVSCYGEIWQSQKWTSENVVVVDFKNRLKSKADSMRDFAKTYGRSGILALCLGGLIELSPAIAKALLPILVDAASSLQEQRPPLSKGIDP